ncbi:MAG TPA: hypothetical protein VIT45_12320 [Allosphingosinicella sp.]
MARRKGRPSLPGKRRANGRLRAKAAGPDLGNIRVQEMRSAFALFQGGKAGNELGDAIGKAWATGLLEGFGADSQAMRDRGRDYGQLWRRCYGALDLRTSSLERRARTGPAPTASTETAAERRFERMDAIVSAFPRLSREAFYGLAADYQDSDNVPPFVERLINERVALKGRAPAGTMPIRGDREKLERAAEILRALVEGRSRR